MPPPNRPLPDIFISYAREDRPKAEFLAHALESRGWSVFWDRTIPAGKTWRDHVGKALTEAKCVVVVWSSAAISSHWVMEEADDGRQRGILVPVLIEDVQPPIGFRSIQAANLIDWNGSATATPFRNLVEAVTGMLGPPPNIAEEEPAQAEANGTTEDVEHGRAKTEQEDKKTGQEAKSNKAERRGPLAAETQRDRKEGEPGQGQAATDAKFTGAGRAAAKSERPAVVKWAAWIIGPAAAIVATVVLVSPLLKGGSEVPPTIARLLSSDTTPADSVANDGAFRYCDDCPEMIVPLERGGFPLASAAWYYRAALGGNGAVDAQLGIPRSVGDSGTVFLTHGQLDSAEWYYRKALADNRTADDQAGIAKHLGDLGTVFGMMGELDSAEAYYRAALNVSGDGGNLAQFARHLGNLGNVFLKRGRADSAASYYRLVEGWARTFDNEGWIAKSLGNLGTVFWTRGQLDSADTYYRTALSLDSVLGNRTGFARHLGNLGNTRLYRGDYQGAEWFYRRALGVDSTASNQAGVARHSGNLGNALQMVGRLDEAEQIYRSTLARFEAAGHPFADAIRVALEEMGR